MQSPSIFMLGREIAAGAANSVFPKVAPQPTARQRAMFLQSRAFRVISTDPESVISEWLASHLGSDFRRRNPVVAVLHAASASDHMSSESMSAAVQRYSVRPAAIAGVWPFSDACFRQKL